MAVPARAAELPTLPGPTPVLKWTNGLNGHVLDPPLRHIGAGTLALHV